MQKLLTSDPTGCDSPEASLALPKLSEVLPIHFSVWRSQIFVSKNLLLSHTLSIDLPAGLIGSATRDAFEVLLCETMSTAREAFFASQARGQRVPEV